MAILLALCLVQIIITLLFAPVRLKVRGHASLEFLKAELDVELFNLRPIRLRSCVGDGEVRVLINGKPPKKPQTDPFKALPYVKKAFDEGVRVKLKASVFVCARDALYAAIIEAIGGMLPKHGSVKCSAYASSGGERFEIDVNATLKASVMQLAGVAL